MFEFRDLFQWDRFITPTIIKTFYWLAIALMILFGISGIFSGLAAMAIRNPYWNPRSFDAPAIRALLQDAWEGRRPSN